MIGSLFFLKFYVRHCNPASITAVEFYKKQGYDYKNGINELDDEGHYRLEKFNVKKGVD